MRSIFIRFREYVGNRRRAPRYDVSLPVTVHVRSAPELASGASVPPVTGFTRDISSSGMALVMPAIRTGAVYLTREGTSLRLTLELLDGSRLTLDGAPVRYHQLEPENSAKRLHLIGVRFTEVGDAERKRLNDLLASLA